MAREILKYSGIGVCACVSDISGIIMPKNEVIVPKSIHNVTVKNRSIAAIIPTKRSARKSSISAKPITINAKQTQKTLAPINNAEVDIKFIIGGFIVVIVEYCIIGLRTFIYKLKRVRLCR
jgi:hypothetical protein